MYKLSHRYFEINGRKSWSFSCQYDDETPYSIKLTQLTNGNWESYRPNSADSKDTFIHTNRRVVLTFIFNRLIAIYYIRVANHIKQTKHNNMGLNRTNTHERTTRAFINKIDK